METLVHQKIILVLILVNLTQNFITHNNADNSYLFVNGKEIFKFKADNENVKFSIQCCLGSTSNGFSATESREVKASKFPKG